MGRSTSARMLACTMSLGLALTFAGCSTDGSASSESQNDSASRPTPSTVPEPTKVGSAAKDKSAKDDTAGDDDNAGEFDPSAIEDSGPREHASGEAKQDEDGYWYYKVASGDVAGVICDRFGRSSWQLETFDAQGGFDCHSMIYPGQILIPTVYDEDHERESPWVPSKNPFDD